MRKIALITLWMLAQMVSPAQTTYENMPNLVSGLTKYRSKLMEQTPKEIERLRDFEERWLAGWTKEEKNEFYKFQWNIAHIQLKRRPAFKRLYKGFKKHKVFYPKYPLTEAELAIFVENAELIHWRGMRYLEYAYPYSIRTDSLLVAELAFYDIQNDENIAEIGAGTGDFSMVLALTYPSLTITVNELTGMKLLRMKRLFQANKDLIDVEKITVARGSSRSTELEKDGFDRIIVRNSLHHFTQKADMLSSIRKSMDSGAKLYIKETPIECTSSSYTCTEMMAESEILRLFAETGFVVRRTLRQEYFVVWELE